MAQAITKTPPRCIPSFKATPSPKVGRYEHTYEVAAMTEVLNGGDTKETYVVGKCGHPGCGDLVSIFSQKNNRWFAKCGMEYVASMSGVVVLIYVSFS